jgi:excisionase family DNA binding protein
MAQPLIYLNPTDRVEQAWAEVRRLRALRHEIESDLAAAEAVLDVERRRETPGGQNALMSVKDAATRITVSESKLWKAIRAGRLEITKVGRNTRVSDAQLTVYLESER